MRRVTLLTLTWVLSGCGHAAAPASAPTTNSAPSAPSVPAKTQALGEILPRELGELGRELAAERVTGSIALYDSQTGLLGCSDLKRCQEGAIPASTFDIPGSMIALEAGVVDGPETILPWDGKTYQVDAWNRDLSLRDALRVSCVPCYRAIARKLDQAQMKQWVDKLDYGNHDTSGGVDRFWLWGALRISPLQQIDLLRRFDGDKLPISTRSADIVRDIMTLDVSETYVLRGKTGSTAPPEEPRELGWFVGWLELGQRRIFFATLLDGHDSDVDLLAARRRVTERVLHAQGYL
jgi:beta-lactamase class D